MHSDYTVEVVDADVFFAKTSASYCLVICMQVLSISPSSWKQESLKSPPVGDYNHF